MESGVEYHINTKATKMLKSGQKSIQQDSNRRDHMKHGLTEKINLYKKRLSGQLDLLRNKVPVEVVGLGCVQWPLPRD